MDDTALLHLMAWLSPSFPVGAFGYSHGLEQAVECGLVRSRDALTDWLADLLAYGGGWADAVLFCHAHRAVTSGDAAALAATCELAEAMPASAELLRETMAQGTAFLRAGRDVWPTSALDSLGAEAPYPIAVAVMAAGRGIALAPSLAAYLHGFTSNLVSAAVRLVPLGQTDGLRVIAALEPSITRVARAAGETPLDQLGTAALMVDWCAMSHETQYTRLFRS